MNHREQVAARIEELRGVPGVAVRQSEIRPPVSAAELAEARTLARNRLPEGVEGFYTRLNGFTLAWDYAPPGQSGRPTDSGSIDILPLATRRRHHHGPNLASPLSWTNPFSGASS